MLDEEAQLMASMGLPLAFVSSSDQRRAVSPTCCWTVPTGLCVLCYAVSLNFMKY